MQSILVVEDDALLGKALMSTLENAGYNTILVQEGNAVIPTVKKSKFDLIFLDIMLPGMNGYEILKLLKSDTTTQNIPVVMLTNLGEMEQINKLMSMGATDYIIKSNTDLKKIVTLIKEKYLH